jgi:MoxR-like ATPase
VTHLRESLNAVLKGKSAVIDQVLICLLARGHLLLEDKPGLGKTTLAKALASAVHGRFARIQCTPDLLPSDITGFNIFNQKSQQFEFREGPVFSDVLLADEINRATPRTQSALLEAMAERQVTVDSEKFELSEEFFVIATQNPIEQHGTYPLPEAQLDRFAMKLSIGYPEPVDEEQMLHSAASPQAEARPPQASIIDPGQLRSLQSLIAVLPIARSLQRYLVALGTATRGHPHVELGLSPRGLLIWQRVAQASAFLAGRDFVIPEDIQETAQPVLSVRLGVEHEQPAHIIDELLEATPLPPYEVPDV